jgi:glycyl-tRNA synthetase (class II)
VGPILIYSCATLPLLLPTSQVGRSFRNEIAVGNFIFRTREFDQMELQYFCVPEESASHYEAWVTTCHEWLSHVTGLSPDRVRRRVYAQKVRGGVPGSGARDSVRDITMHVPPSANL